MAIVIVLLATLTMGVMEFGRAWMINNMIVQAAREGARAAAVAPRTNRDPDTGLILSTAGIETLVKGQIAGVLDAASVAAFTVNVTQPTVGGIPVVRVTVNGSAPYIFNLGGTDFSVARSVTFRDEGR